MCVILVKPVGKKMPSSETLKKCFLANPHGAGYMYAKDGKVHIRKGFKTLNSLIDSLNELITECNHKTSEIPLVLHFRIATSGGFAPEITHPYALSDSYKTMKKLSNDVSCGIAHNGIIRCTSAGWLSDHNDSMEFIKNVVYPLVKSPDDLRDLGKMTVLENLTVGSRLVYLFSDGSLFYTGDWIDDDGYIFSNMHWKSYVPRFKSY